MTWPQTAEELLEAAWGLIANAGWDAGSGDVAMAKSPGWHEAALRWRDGYHQYTRERAGSMEQEQELAAAADSLAVEKKESTAEKVIEGTFVRLEHVIETVARFAHEHPGLDRIFVQGLLTELQALEATGGLVIPPLDEAPKEAADAAMTPSTGAAPPADAPGEASSPAPEGSQGGNDPKGVTQQ